MTTLKSFAEPISPSPADSELAGESSRTLARLIAGKSKKRVRVQVKSESGVEQSVLIPSSALQLLQAMLSEMGKGHAITLVPVRAELTTQQAADLLKVSRPFLVEQLKKGAIAYRKVGAHRRVLLKDLLSYKRAMDQSRLKALDELSALDQELGLGY